MLCGWKASTARCSSPPTSHPRRATGLWPRLAAGKVLPDPPPAAQVSPVYDEDGLVAERPGEARFHYGDPMFQSYDWVAMLDPVEFADGADLHLPRGTAVEAPVFVDELVEVDHHGRSAWQARCRPSATYWPGCPCCALLLSPESDALDRRRTAAH